MKIVCTIGPNSRDPQTITALAKAGMNVARLNLSHGSHDDHRRAFDALRHASLTLHKPIATLLDLQGPKIRIGTFEHGAVTLAAGQRFSLTTDSTVVGDQQRVYVSYPDLPRDVRAGEKILLDDGNIALRVEETRDDQVLTTVIQPGRLSDRKGVNLPGTTLSLSPLGDKDRADLAFGLELGVDFVALSFVQSAEEIRELRALIEASVHPRTRVIAKIEKPRALSNIDEIISESDGIMLARGDLGVEMAVEEVPLLQKRIIELCNRAEVPVITATQMLESMIGSPRPTRAEASDVANAVLDGTDAVMLSAETAVGAYPVQAVETMSRIISLIERDRAIDRQAQRRGPGHFKPSQTVAYSCANAVEMIDAAAIISISLIGNMARRLARFRPTCPIISATPDETTFRQTALTWGVTGYLTAPLEGTLHRVALSVLEQLKQHGALDEGDLVLVTAPLPFSYECESNTMVIKEVT